MQHAKWTVWLMSALMCTASVAGLSIRPETREEPNFLEAAVPKTFSGGWKDVEAPAQVVSPGTRAILEKTYRELLTRTYQNAAGERIMLSLARSGNQVGVQQAHLPDLCYPAQGLAIVAAGDGELSTPLGSIRVRRLSTNNGSRYEPVTYWLTMADRVVMTAWEKRLIQVRTLLTGESPGGLLFRVSSIDRDSKRGFAAQDRFVADLMASVSPEARRKLAGLD